MSHLHFAAPRRGRPSLWLRTLCLPILLGVVLALAGCARLPTYVAAQATAQAGGCWPDYLPTPPLVTVTPAGSALPGTPQPIRRRWCPARRRPGRTAVRWPTPVPPPPAFPTQAGRPWQTGSGQATTLLLPDAVLALDMAVHPTAGWPAVAAVVWSGTDDPERVMVSVDNPRAARWSIARQVDLGPARIGRYTRTVRVAIERRRAGDGGLGHERPGLRRQRSALAVWASDSDDVGETWSAPTRVAVGCRRVNDAVSVGYLLRRLLRGDTPAPITRIPLAAPA